MTAERNVKLHFISSFVMVFYTLQKPRKKKDNFATKISVNIFPVSIIQIFY